MSDLIHIPETPAEFLQPKASSVVAEMKALLRNPEHYAEAVQYLKAMAGETKSIHGSARYDEAGCVFAIKDICRLNGYTLLAKLEAAEISRVFKFAFKGNTGLTIRQLQKQGTQLRLEHRHKEKEAPSEE